jgi:hypothetical protein
MFGLYLEGTQVTRSSSGIDKLGYWENASSISN